MCPDIRAIFKDGSAELILSLLLDEVVDTDNGLVLMKPLQAERPIVFNRVLCLLYDIACYCNADTCFADKVAPEDLGKWFISTPADAVYPRSDDALLMQRYANLEEAEAAAVQALGLAQVFFAEVPLQHAEPLAA